VTNLDARIPQTRADPASLLEQPGKVLAAAKGHDKDVDVVLPRLLRRLLRRHARLGDGEDAVDAKRDAHAGDLALAREHAHEVVVSAAGGDGACTMLDVV
jgi:hypothetical protein